MKLTRKSLTGLFLKSLFFLTGSIILSFGLFNIHTQSGITEGGLLGAALLLLHWTGISPGLTISFVSIILYLLGLKRFGKKFFLLSTVSSFLFTLCYSVFESFGYLIPNLADKPLLAAILGGLCVGCGCGLLVSAGGVSGGDDVLAFLIHDKTKLSLPISYLTMDVLVLILSLSYISLGRILFSLLTVTISSFLIGRVTPIYPKCYQLLMNVKARTPQAQD